MKHLVRFLTLFACLGTVVACDYLYMEPFTVSSHSPQGPTVATADLEELDITLVFSQIANRLLVEHSFLALKAASEAVSGTLTWTDDYTLVFHPDRPFASHQGYRIQLESDASDIYGNSLAETFILSFSDSTETTRPWLSGHSPEDQGRLELPFGPLGVEFSEAMDIASVLAGLQINPGIGGIWTWDPQGRSFQFTPGLPWASQTEYILTIKNTVSDIQGNTMAEAQDFTFRYGLEDEPPVLDQVASSEGLILSPGVEITQGVSTHTSLTLSFSEPVNLAKLKSRISFEPALSFYLDPDSRGFSDQVGIHFDSDLAWNGVYRLQLGEGYQDAWGNPGQGIQYRFCCNAPTSRPPVWLCPRGVGFPESPNPDTATGLTLLGDYDSINFSGYRNTLVPSLPEDLGYFDLVVRLADAVLDDQGRNLLVQNFLSAFSIQVTSGPPVEIDVLGAWVYENGDNPVPSFAPGQGTLGTDEVVFRVFVSILRRDGVNGTVTLTLDETFSDQHENVMTQTQVMEFQVH